MTCVPVWQRPGLAVARACGARRRVSASEKIRSHSKLRSVRKRRRSAATLATADRLFRAQTGTFFSSQSSHVGLQEQKQINKLTFSFTIYSGKLRESWTSSNLFFFFDQMIGQVRTSLMLLCRFCTRTLCSCEAEPFHWPSIPSVAVQVHGREGNSIGHSRTWAVGGPAAQSSPTS